MNSMKNKLVYLILITIIMALFTGITIGFCIGINSQKQIINTGDIYKYYDEPIDDEPNVWNI
uniref:Uncharacterized protein n=2 Tax=root TaxID=1 RepID=A0A8S5P4B0_9CAUD|nr:MAG TPA: protein of unknown function (DUF5016) [Siphoviridae sp. ctQtc11]